MNSELSEAPRTVGPEQEPEGPAPPTLELALRSGSVPLGFVEEGTTVFLVARQRGAQWPIQVLRDGSVTLRLPDRHLRAPVALVTDPEEKARVLEMFRSRYGPRRFERWYADPARILVVHGGLRPPADAAPDSYHDWLRAEFDNVADDYDRHITGNRINRLLRDRSILELRRSFADARRLLEVGCGSGMETLPLLRDGHEVVCVDISDRMLDVVREKARREGLSERLETHRLAAAELARHPDGFGRGRFDGAYSTYGAMNCEADLFPFARRLADLVRPGGRFVAGVYNRWCLFELVGYGLTGRFSRAVGRAHEPVPVGTSRFCVDVFSFSPGGFARLFEPEFEVERVEGVPVLLPPSDLAGYVERFANGFGRLARLDEKVGALWPFNRLGDHFLMTLRRRTSGPIAAAGIPSTVPAAARPASVTRAT